MSTPTIIETPVSLPQAQNDNLLSTSLLSPRTHIPSPSRSPIRPRFTDDLLANLSPATTLEALSSTTTSGALKASIDGASPTQRSFGVRAAVASKNIQEWLDELSSWPWSEERSAGFQPPVAHTEISRQNAESASAIQSEEYWGSLPVEQVLQYEARIDEIAEDIEVLDVADLKFRVLETHYLSRSRPTSSHGSPSTPTASLSGSYSKMDDFTAVVTATVLQALPALSKLNKLLNTWGLRLAVLREIQPLTTAMEDAETALKTAWQLLSHHRGCISDSALSSIAADTEASVVLTRSDFVNAKHALSDKVVLLGQRVDYLLDSLEGQEDTVPDSWLDRMDAIETSHSEWVVAAELRVREGEWQAEINLHDEQRDVHAPEGISTAHVSREVIFKERPRPSAIMTSASVVTPESQHDSGTVPSIPSSTQKYTSTSYMNQPTEVTHDKSPTLVKEIPEAGQPCFHREFASISDTSAQVDGPSKSADPRDEGIPLDVSDESLPRPFTPMCEKGLNNWRHTKPTTLSPRLGIFVDNTPSNVLPIGAMMSAIASIPLRVRTPSSSEHTLTSEDVVAKDAERVKEQPESSRPTTPCSQSSSSESSIRRVLRSPSNQPKLDRYLDDGDSPRSPRKAPRSGVGFADMLGNSASPIVTSLSAAAFENVDRNIQLVNAERFIEDTPSPRRRQAARSKASYTEPTNVPHLSPIDTMLPIAEALAFVDDPQKSPIHKPTVPFIPSLNQKRSNSIIDSVSRTPHILVPLSASNVTGYTSSEPSPEIEEAQPAGYFRPLSPVRTTGGFPDASQLYRPALTQGNDRSDSKAEVGVATGVAKSDRLDQEAAQQSSNPLDFISAKSFHLRTVLVEEKRNISAGTTISAATATGRSDEAVDTTFPNGDLLADGLQGRKHTDMGNVSLANADNPALSKDPVIYDIEFDDEPPESLGFIAHQTSHLIPQYGVNGSFTPELEVPLVDDITEEAPIFDNITLTATPIATVTSKGNDSKLQQQINNILSHLPTQITLENPSTASNSGTTSQLTVGKRRIPQPVASRSRSSSRAATPPFTLSPAHSATKARPKHYIGNPEIKVYHLSRSEDEPSIKLFIRLVGEYGERVMVRVGGGWADLEEYLKEYASHHGTVKASKVEIQSTATSTPRRVSGASTSGRSSVTGLGGRASPSPMRPGSSMGLERPRSSLGPALTLRQRRSHGQLGNRNVDGERMRFNTPPPRAARPSPSNSSPKARYDSSPDVARASPEQTCLRARPSSRLNYGDESAVSGGSGSESPGDYILANSMRLTPTSSPRGSIGYRRSSNSSRRESDAYGSPARGELGLAGPKARTGSISKEKQDWVESMKEKVIAASAEKDKAPFAEEDFGKLGKVGNTKRLFMKNM